MHFILTHYFVQIKSVAGFKNYLISRSVHDRAQSFERIKLNQQSTSCNSLINHLIFIAIRLEWASSVCVWCVRYLLWPGSFAFHVTF